MALSGSVSTNAHDGRYLKVSWSGVPNVAANSTTVSWTINAIGGNDSWYTTGPVRLWINGTKVYEMTGRVDMRTSWSASSSDTGNSPIVIQHNEDGTKRFGISLEAAIETYAVNCSGSGEFNLNPIARNPDAPTALGATANHGGLAGFGEDVLITWSGASGTISGYEIQVKRGSADWATLASIVSTGTGGSYVDTINDTAIAKTGAGKTLQYRVRAMNGSLPSAWITSNVLTMGGGMDLNVSGAWKTGTVWKNVAGTWKRAARVWKKVAGTWKESE